MSKLSLHFQHLPGWSKRFAQEVSLVKIVDPAEDDPFPGVRIVGRPFMPDHESNAMIWKGADGADEWYTRWGIWIARRPYLWAIEGPNEPQPMADATFRYKLDAFTLRLARIFTAKRLRLVGHNWSVGWPDLGDAPDFAYSVAALHNGGHVLGLHEYSAPAMWDVKNYHCLRYRATVRELRNTGVPIPKVLVGECGIDGGVISRPKTGWHDYATEDEYIAQLAWYDGKLMEDPYILAATIFSVCDWDWHSFNVDESLAMKLAAYIAAHPSPIPPDPTPPIPPPEPPEPDPNPPIPPPEPPADSRWPELLERVGRITDLVEARLTNP